MVDSITVNTQNSIRITSRVGVIYIDPLEIPDDKNDADYILITYEKLYIGLGGDEYDFFRETTIDPQE